MFTGTLQSFTVNNTINIYGQLVFFLSVFFNLVTRHVAEEAIFFFPSVPLHAATAPHILVPLICLRAESQRRICAAVAAMRTRRLRRHRRSERVMIAVLHVIFDSEQEVVV